MAKKRQSVTFSGEATKVLEDLAAERNVSVSEVLRTALAREEWFDQASKTGTIFYKEKDSTEPPHEVQFVG